MPRKAPPQTRLWLAIALLLLPSLACKAFEPSTEPGLSLPPPPTAIAEPTHAADELLCEGCDIAPTATANVEEATRSAGEEQASILLNVDLNVRGGPGVHYDRVTFILKGERTDIVGKDPESGWWKIACPSRSDAVECWISGGTQYSTAFNAGGVPVAAIPATPTPVPPTPEAVADGMAFAGGLLVYGGDGGLWAVSLDLNQDPPLAAVPRLLSELSTLSNLSISPDGLNVAYLTGSSEANELHIVNLDENDDRILLSSGELPAPLEENMAIRLAQIHWLADSQGVLFNTRISDFGGSGNWAREDLWTVTLDGTLTERLGAGMGGGYFTLSPDNKLLMSQATAISRVNLDGGNPEALLDFDLVETGSEYVYYAQPQWIGDGSIALAAIPSPNQFEPEAFAQLWRIPATGPAEPLKSLPGNTLFNSVRWSAGGSFLAYVQQIVDGTNMPRTLALATGEGEGLTAYATGNIGPFVSWSPAGESFLYTDDGFFVVGTPGSGAASTTIPAGTVGARWLTSETFMIPTIVDGKWQFIMSNLSGERSELTTASVEYVEFDIWIP